MNDSAKNGSTGPAPDPSDKHELDYDIDEAVVASSTAQLKAIADETRDDILKLLSERAATISQLADALGKPKGTIGYHTKVLEDADLIRVVRTNKVRAMTEKYYGRTGRTIILADTPKPDDPLWFINDALKHLVVEEGSKLPMFTSRVARIPAEHAEAFADRIVEIAEEFLDMPRSGNTVYGFVGGVFPTDHPAFHDKESSE